MPQFPFPGEYLKMINIHFSAQADAVLRPLGLTLAQSDVLLFLDQRGAEETTLQDIARHFRLKHPTVVGLVRRLEDKGFLTSAVSPRDHRCRVLRLTGRYDEVRRVMEQTRLRMDARAVRGFSDAELAQLGQYLARVYHNVCDP